MTCRTRRFAYGAIFLGFCLGVLAIVSYSGGRQPQRQLPNPNGYDDLLAAGSLVRGTLPPKDDSSLDELEAFVATNGPALERLALGLSRESLVPPLDPKAMQTNLNRFSDVKKLAILLGTDAEVARRKQNWNRLVTASTNGVAFAHNLTRGGVLIDLLVALSAEGTAMATLRKASDDLPAEPARRAAASLSALDATREPVANVRAAERDFGRRSLGVFGPIIYDVVFYPWQLRPVIQRAEAKANTTIVQTRDTILHLAARAYRLEHGKPPANPTELVPDYLPAVPVDPATGTPMKLLPRDVAQ